MIIIVTRFGFQKVSQKISINAKVWPNRAVQICNLILPSSNRSFQRALYIVSDIKYLLNTSPDAEVCKTGWSNELRKGFLHGLSNLMDIFSWMQGNIFDSELRRAEIATFFMRDFLKINIDYFF